MKRRKNVTWPTITVPCPDDIAGELLRYWDGIFTPKAGQRFHPDDAEDHKKYRAAIKVLLEFFE